MFQPCFVTSHFISEHGGRTTAAYLSGHKKLGETEKYEELRLDLLAVVLLYSSLKHSRFIAPAQSYSLVFTTAISLASM